MGQRALGQRAWAAERVYSPLKQAPTSASELRRRDRQLAARVFSPHTGETHADGHGYGGPTRVPARTIGFCTANSIRRAARSAEHEAGRRAANEAIKGSADERKSARVVEGRRSDPAAVDPRSERCLTSERTCEFPGAEGRLYSCRRSVGTGARRIGGMAFSFPPLGCSGVRAISRRRRDAAAVGSQGVGALA